MTGHPQLAESAATGDEIGLLTTTEFVVELHERLAAATDRIALQLMTFDGDRAGLAVAAELLAAAERGVSVCLLIDSFALRFVSDTPAGRAAVRDEFGSTLAMFDRLRAGGVAVRFTNGNGPGNVFALARNHKKLYVIDDVAYLGGVNVSDHNFRWHDFMVRLCGEDVVELLHGDFDDSFDGGHSSIEHQVGSIMIVTNRELARCFDRLVAGAERRLVVASPYALDRRLVRLLEASVASVRTVVIAGRNNFRLLEAITPYLATRAARSGVGLRRYPDFSHSKFVLADDQLLVGSSNFGRHSLTCNQEIGLVITDRSFIARFEARFLGDLKPVRISRSRVRRLFGWLATAMMELFLIVYARLIAPRVQLLVAPRSEPGATRPA